MTSGVTKISGAIKAKYPLTIRNSRAILKTAIACKDNNQDSHKDKIRSAVGKIAKETPTLNNAATATATVGKSGATATAPTVTNGQAHRGFLTRKSTNSTM